MPFWFAYGQVQGQFILPGGDSSSLSFYVMNGEFKLAYPQGGIKQSISGFLGVPGLWDANSDGLQDVVDYHSSAVRVFKNVAGGSFEHAPFISIPLPTFNGSGTPDLAMTSCDLDNDGETELILSRGGKAVKDSQISGTERWSPINSDVLVLNKNGVRSAHSIKVSPYVLGCGDFDGDGKKEVIGIAEGDWYQVGGSVNVPGYGTFPGADFIFFTNLLHVKAVATNQIIVTDDKKIDGRADEPLGISNPRILVAKLDNFIGEDALLYLGYSGGEKVFSKIAGDPQGGLHVLQVGEFSGLADPKNISIADLDGDGLAEVMSPYRSMNPTAHGLSIFTMSGSGTFVPALQLQLPENEDIVGINAYDSDFDGDSDTHLNICERPVANPIFGACSMKAITLDNANATLSATNQTRSVIQPFSHSIVVPAAIEGVRLQFNNKLAISDSLGHFEFPRVSPGTYSYSAIKATTGFSVTGSLVIGGSGSRFVTLEHAISQSPPDSKTESSKYKVKLSKSKLSLKGGSITITLSKKNKSVPKPSKIVLRISGTKTKFKLLLKVSPVNAANGVVGVKKVKIPNVKKFSKKLLKEEKLKVRLDISSANGGTEILDSLTLKMK